jgi:hypothetical protein
MRDHDIPESSESGLSTEDIVRAHDRGEAEEPGPETPPPMYPGESIGTASGAGREDTTPTDEAPAGEAQAYEQSEEPQTEESQGGESQEGDSGADDSPALLSPEDEEAFRTRWHDIQSLFVDDPREAVHAADGLVADVMQKLAATFADHRQHLEGQWNKGESDTESLRVALRQYRSFFNRLLTT